MNFFYRILFSVIAVCIPVVCIFGAANIVYRMPDLYVYEFNKNQIADEISLGIKDDELGQFFSDFMSGKEKDFDLFAEYRDREQSVFGTVEQINMENARKLLDRTLYILICAAALALASTGVYLLKKKKYELRTAYKGGIIAYSVLIILILITFSFGQVKSFLNRSVFPNHFGADDVLPQMLTEKFAQMSLIAIAVVSLVILIILVSAVWRVTKPRRMFW